MSKMSEPKPEATPVAEAPKAPMTKIEAVTKAIAYMRGNGDYADLDAVEEVLRSMLSEKCPRRPLAE